MRNILMQVSMLLITY